jgi:hypothetical protein
MESGVEFVAVDNPHANKLTIHILAAVAEHEPRRSQNIPRRLWRPLRQAIGYAGPGRRRETHGQRSKSEDESIRRHVLPIIREMQTAGHTSCNAIAGQLNARKVPTARGGRVDHVQVREILDREADRKA